MTKAGELLSDDQTIGDRLLMLRKELDLSQQEIADRLGVSVRGWQKIERNESIPGGDTLLRLESLGYSPGWILSKSGPKRQNDIQTIPAASDFIAIPFLEVDASAGPGAIAPIHAEVRTVISFERNFLRNLGAMPDWCKIIGARGDSMMPTIPDGALIVVDHSQTEVVSGWISVVNVGGDLLVKRVRRRLDGTVELVSDNPLYPVETIGPDRIDQLTIVGRVVYFCRAP